MAWTDPATGTVATGDIGLSSTWNTLLIDNAIYLKAEVDKLFIATQAQPTRAKDVIYQNTSGKIRHVEIYVEANAGDIGTLRVAAGTPPQNTDAVAGITNDNANNIRIMLPGIIPPNYYYDLHTFAGTIDIQEGAWTEWDLY